MSDEIALPTQDWLHGRCADCDQWKLHHQLKRSNMGSRRCAHCSSENVLWQWGQLVGKADGLPYFVAYAPKGAP